MPLVKSDSLVENYLLYTAQYKNGMGDVAKKVDV